jgi:S-DNA-T family DNA segregation ATPase FtsK/SpoIIIE
MFDERSLKLDLFALALLAATLFLGLALTTYNPADPPSALVYPAQEHTSNLCGRWGALAANGMFKGFGVGAYYLVFSMAVLDVLLLGRREINAPVWRAIGWIASLVGLTTFAALTGSILSPGPVIGAGGYLGATGRGILEMNFANVGAYILTAAVTIAGLMMCTDYLLFRIIARLFGAPMAGIKQAGGAIKSASAAKAAKKVARSDLDGDSPDKKLNVRISGKEVGKEVKPEPAVPKLEAVSEDDAVDEELDEEADVEEEVDSAEAEEPEEEPSKRSLGSRLASALRIKAPPDKSEREEVIEELNAAASVDDDASDYELPSIDMLLPGEAACTDELEKDVRRKAKILEKTFLDFGFRVKVVEIETGPVIAQFEVELEAGLRLSKITSLSEDLAIALRVPSVRIVAPIPGKNTVGIEVPNSERQLVRLREVIEESQGKTAKMRIPVFLGKDVSGKPMVVDLTTLPHLLIAGRTGTGKSVCLNTLIVSMLMTRRPDEVKMLMIDPKMVELSCYKSLPHLMHPVVTDMRKAEAILAWAVDKMEERYALLARAGVRHITSYNQLGEEELMDRLQPESDEERKNIPTHLPFIVIVADELADLMMTSAKEVEQHIIRLAQKSRAVGIHLVLATQKPTVDVITGLIKSNLPARIAFQVASRTDSRVVLDEMGADKLLGNGDMLFLWPGTSTLLRGQGTYVSDDEINAIVAHVGTNEPQFVTELVQLKAKDPEGESKAGKLPNRDEMYEAAVDVVIRERRGSVSLLQRSLGIGYGRAARLIDYMAEDGIVGPYNGSNAREVLMTPEQWEAMQNGGSVPAVVPTLASPPRSNRIQVAPKSPPRVADDELDDEVSEEDENAPFDVEEEEAYDEEYRDAV